jgi:26S proteasome regulatory subunit N12
MFLSCLTNIFFLLQRDWNLKAGDYYAFQIDVKKSDDSLSALDLAKQAVEYARELEMIV